MKRLYAKAYASLFLLMGLFSFVACEVYVGDDDYYGDHNRAYTLSGQWKGDFGMFYAVPNPATGQMVQFDATYTNIIFYPQYSGARYGYGKQVDYYNHGPYAYQYYYFKWEVRNRDIYITYPQDPNLNVVIYDYYLDNYTFTGYMGDSRYRFRLNALRSYDLWDSFRGDYFFGPNSDWSWGTHYSQGMSPSSFDSLTFSVVSKQNSSTDNSNIVRGNRFLTAAE